MPDDPLSEALAETQDAKGVRSDHWRGQDYADGYDAGIEFTVEKVRAYVATIEARAEADLEVLSADYDAQCARADAAEAKVARVKALCEKWKHSLYARDPNWVRAIESALADPEDTDA